MAPPRDCLGTFDDLASFMDTVAGQRRSQTGFNQKFREEKFIKAKMSRQGITQEKKI